MVSSGIRYHVNRNLIRKDVFCLFYQKFVWLLRQRLVFTGSFYLRSALCAVVFRRVCCIVLCFSWPLSADRFSIQVYAYYVIIVLNRQSFPVSMAGFSLSVFSMVMFYV